MFSLKENGELEINTYLNGGSAIDPAKLRVPDMNDYLEIDTMGRIKKADGTFDTVDKIECTRKDASGNLKAECSNLAALATEMAGGLSVEDAVKTVGPKSLVAILKDAGFKAVTGANGRNMVGPAPATVTDAQQLMTATAVANWFNGAGNRFINRADESATLPDAATGVEYNVLKEKVDYEALQHQINESHIRFKLSVQGLFGSVGYNPQFTIGVSAQQGGYAVTKDELEGGMIPALVPISIVSKVPSFSGDIRMKINQGIAALKSAGKKLTTGSEEAIEKVMSSLEKEEQQLKTLATSLENIARDPAAPKDITQETVEKYSDKLKSHQTRGLDIGKTLLDILAAVSSTTPVPATTPAELSVAAAP